MDIALATFIIYGVFMLIGLLIAFYTARWIFSVARHLRYMEAQIITLLEIARINGVSEEIIEEIKDHANNKRRIDNKKS